MSHVRKTSDQQITEKWRDEFNNTDVTVTFHRSDQVPFSWTCCDNAPTDYVFPEIDKAVLLWQRPGWKFVSSEFKDIYNYDTGTPGTIFDLMKEIRALVPGVSEKHDEITALIKSHIHGEKYGVWSFINLHFKDLVESNEHLKEIVTLKKEIHGPEGWLNYWKNLEWVKKYAQKG
jgi:hypothetical protein